MTTPGQRPGPIRSRAKRELEAAEATDREPWERVFYVRHGYWPSTGNPPKR